MTPSFDLTGRVALVTGGNSGIGLAMATALAGAGARVALAGRSEEKNRAAVAALTANGHEAMAIRADLSDESAGQRVVDETLAAFGRLDILVNNAGTNDRKPPQDYTLAEWNALIAINLTSAFACAQAAYPAMKAGGGGKIICIGSMLSLFGAAFAAPYAAAKGGMVQMSKSLASAWAPDNIQVNAVLPGWIDTELTVAARSQVSGLQQRVVDRTPAGRWGTPADLAGIAVFLASPASDFVTGTAIPVDGGYAAQV